MIVGRIPALIVGAGPVGLALAADLGWRGSDCWLVEKSDGAISQPKMDMVGIRTMEFCRRWGIVDWVEASPYPRDYPQDNVYVESLVGYEFGREIVPSKNDEKVPPQSPQKRERCPQDMFDPIMQRLVRTFPSVTLKYRTTLISYEEREDEVVARLRDEESGEEYEVVADYLVGTDGGASSVRSQAGIRMIGKPVLTHTTNIIFRCEDLVALHDKGKAYRFIFIGPEGTWLTIVAINGADRWRMSIVGTDEPRSYSDDEISALIRRAVGRDFDFEILSIMPWVRRELVADSYGTKRVFIAGDSAHLMSPTGGFGMNTGMGDAIDLSWKLNAVLEGWGGPHLLQSYEAERKPVAERNVAEASNNLKLMLTPRTARPPTEIFEPGAEGDAARKEFGDAYAQMMKREWYTIGIHLGYNYAGSPAVVDDGTPPPPPEVATYTQTSRPGARAPHVWLDDGRSTLDLFGRGFTLLRIGADAPEGTAIAAPAEQAGVPLTVHSLLEPAVAEAYGCRLALVRPDGHVAWRGDDEPADPRVVIDIVRGVRTASARSQCPVREAAVG
jgi:2-polyprenyl-6-methoxyphenol hydroxylase-like FAD-dependent oxidoreductase